MKKESDNLGAKSSMLIRRPAGIVFEALVNPDITSRFWFTNGSGRLEEGKTVKWEWGQFGLSAEITVQKVKENEFISFQWPVDEEGASQRTVEISFEFKSEKTTFVEVIEKGFDAADENLIDTIAGQTEGWALVLSAMKAFLEYDINLNLISDHKPG